MAHTALDAFHPAVSEWFAQSFAAPTPAQVRGWSAIRSRRPTLIAAPTGSGKTLAAFLTAIDSLVREASERGGERELPDETRVVYVSPLKALSNDIERNLHAPLAGIQRALERRGLPPAPLRVAVRTGDTPSSARQAMLRRPPHLFVTTPESLYILLTSARGREMLATTRTIIVDEIHALVGNKRGAHLALTVERLAALARDRVGAAPLRVGLSATQRPIEEVAAYLVGSWPRDQAINRAREAVEIIDEGHRREADLALELPGSPLSAVMSHEVWAEVYDRIAALIQGHKTTLVFVNTRRMAERVTRHLAERVGAERIGAHHGSMSKEKRLRCEQRLKAGELAAIVSTASLELGIDIGAVDLVCQLGSPRSIAAFLQRVGRSGHSVGETPKGRLFPITRDDLIECAALLDSVRRGELDQLEMPQKPLDILAQQLVAAVAAREPLRSRSRRRAEEDDDDAVEQEEEVDTSWGEDELFELVTRAYPYRGLDRDEFDAIVEMLADGFSTRRGRRGALLHRDAVNHRLRPRRGARLTAITCGGAIPDTGDYEVLLEPAGLRVGTVHEDFAVESMAGDVFQLGNSSWRVVKVEPGRLRVEDAAGQPPSIPFWLGEAPGRTRELSAAVARLRVELGELLAREDGAALRHLVETLGLALPAAEQLAEYLAAGQAALGAMPSQDTLVLERFFDESGGMQLVLHSPFGSRINRAWGLSLRKRFCRRFNFELQAAATDDAIVISLGEVHSFPLEDVFRFLQPAGLRDLLVQALLDAPMFEIRWRWNAGRALAVPRRRSGKKVAPQLQRMLADDLAAVVFPDANACLENITGAREVPDHPLVQQTIEDCLREAMDIEGFEALIADIVAGKKRLVTADLTEPSPLSHEVLNANPYAFLDDAPLEERRTQAVRTRRWLDPRNAAELATLDPAAIARVRAQAWPEAESADELHDGLVLLGYMTEQEGLAGRSRSGRPWSGLLAKLASSGRATTLTTPAGARVWVAAERLEQLWAALGGAERCPLEPLITPPRRRARDEAGPARDPDLATLELTRARLGGLGPTTAAALAGALGLATSSVDAALLALESEGYALRGRFTARAEAPAGEPLDDPRPNPDLPEEEWCERGLLARIHRYTIRRLRAEIQPVDCATFMRFLTRWHGVAGPSESRGEGRESLRAAVERLEGFEAPAVAWETELLPARLRRYEPEWLDTLCLSGHIVWGSVRAGSPRGRRRSGPLRSTPVALLTRENLDLWVEGPDEEEPEETPEDEAPRLSSDARRLLAVLQRGGALFFRELVAATGLLRTQAETALGELVAAGELTSDSFAGLRALLGPKSATSGRGAAGARGRGRRGRASRARRALHDTPLDRAGRWSTLAPRDLLTDDMDEEPDLYDPDDSERAEAVARVLLRRYGVVFRRLLKRERNLPPWRALLRALRRLEARGELRGGRFVSGGRVDGEQYALPEAVGLLRAARRDGEGDRDRELLCLSAADPLNLLGVILPGERVPAVAGNRILLRGGEAVAVLQAGEVRHLVDPTPEQAWAANTALHRGTVTRRA